MIKLDVTLFSSEALRDLSYAIYKGGVEKERAADRQPAFNAMRECMAELRRRGHMAGDISELEELMKHFRDSHERRKVEFRAWAFKNRVVTSVRRGL